MVTATGSALASKSIPTGRGVVGDKFNQGYGTFHQEEIEVGKLLADAALAFHGTKESRRLLKSDPAAVFAPFRYGRRVDDDAKAPGGGWLMTAVDREWTGGKATSRHIMVPDRSGWMAVCRRISELTRLPRWAGGFTATAEALDDSGYAIAESIAAMVLWHIESDDDLCFRHHARDRARSRSR
jgi:hypothetical protein